MELFPAMPLEAWQDTKQTLHRFCQVIGKLRLAASVRRNHWWKVAFHLTGRGIITRPIGQADRTPVVCFDVDLVDHQLRIATLDRRAVAVPLTGQSVASFHTQTLGALASLGISVAIAHPHPYDLPDTDRPFADDTTHASDDPAWVSCWHTVALAHTRFGDRHIDQPPATDPVTREASSRELISFGFWFGDDRLGAPAFSADPAPEPPGLAGEPLWPAVAWWLPHHGGHLAVLGSDDARTSDDHRVSVLGFYERAYQAGARLAGWDIGRLASPGGITDPHQHHHQDQPTEQPHQ
jgi:hypothetical protein